MLNRKNIFTKMFKWKENFQACITWQKQNAEFDQTIPNSKSIYQTFFLYHILWLCCNSRYTKKCPCSFVCSGLKGIITFVTVTKSYKWVWMTWVCAHITCVWGNGWESSSEGANRPSWFGSWVWSKKSTVNTTWSQNTHTEKEREWDTELYHS